MIRFNCPHCNRIFEIAPALARLPLICKGCGQPVTVPEQSTIPDAPAPKIERPGPAPPKPGPQVRPAEVLPRPADPAFSESAPAKSDAGDERELLFEMPDAMAEFELEARQPKPEPALAPASRPAAAPPAPARAGERKLLGLAVDVAVVLILLVVGVVCGELLAKQSTRVILREAGTAAKFPPLELLMWMSPTMLFLLGYALLASRGRSVGGWLKRRAAA